jgi:hypothetical protein
MAQQAQLIHVTRDGERPDLWYIIDANNNIISPVTNTLEQLRWALGQMCFAVNSEPMEVEE